MFICWYLQVTTWMTRDNSVIVVLAGDMEATHMAGFMVIREDYEDSVEFATRFSILDAYYFHFFIKKKHAQFLAHASFLLGFSRIMFGKFNKRLFVFN